MLAINGQTAALYVFFCLDFNGYDVIFHLQQKIDLRLIPRRPIPGGAFKTRHKMLQDKIFGQCPFEFGK